MMNKMQLRMQRELESLQEQKCLRSLPCVEHRGKMICTSQGEMLNLSSNDYLGLASDDDLKSEFLQRVDITNFQMSSSSSRLLTGNYKIFERVENHLAEMFARESALVFNCGYHANTGILPAITDSNTLILADKLVHASLIDGIRLCQSRSMRFRHNDYTQLERLVEEMHSQYESVIIVTESVFSMDGDVADLPRLCALKKRYDNVMLYVDEAHGFGVLGETGLGLAEQTGCIAQIDILVATLGKALASQGAFVICDRLLRDYLVNRMRTFIFTTALAPMNMMWTDFLLSRLVEMKQRREHLMLISHLLCQSLSEKGFQSDSCTQILPMVLGESARAVAAAKELQRQGFYVLPVRPPTVAQGASRLRFSLTAAVSEQEIYSLIASIDKLTV